MFSAIFILGGLGIVIGICLAVASKVFYVYVDPKIEAVEGALPGANCGGCGLPGCSANAEAIVKGKAAPNSCVAGSDETTEAIAAILGVAIEAKEPEIAKPGCTFGVAEADLKFYYDGVSDCKAAALLSGGMKVCSIGCLGLGSCMKACPFGAISMGPDGLPVVDEEACTGCGTCERVCPKHIITLSSVTRRILKEYTLDECTTPCQRACPAGIDIKEYIRQISIGDYLRAVQVIKERNPFPTVIGRICPRPCEEQCRRNLIDEPVAINFLKRFVADYEKKIGKRALPYKAPPTNRKIAFVGAGVEGLSAAFFSARLGHDTVVFEATDKPGGLLRSAIASYRLPKEILDWDIQGVLEMGVELQTGMALGKDFSVASLLSKGYEAVFTAVGGWDSRLIRGNETEKILGGSYLIIDLIMGDSERHNKIPVGDNIIIAGGDHSTVQAAQICRDLGSDRITVILRENGDVIPGDRDLIEELEADGVEFIRDAAVTKIQGIGKHIRKATYTLTKTGETVDIPVDTLFLGAGRFPEMIFTQINKDAEETAIEESHLEWEGIPCLKKPEIAGETGLFAKGDAVTDYSAAIRAIGAGRRAAANIHKILYGIPLENPENIASSECALHNVDRVECVPQKPRNLMPLGELTGPDPSMELEKGYDEKMVVAEASRCLQCGLICYEKTGAEEKQERSAA